MEINHPAIGISPWPWKPPYLSVVLHWVFRSSKSCETTLLGKPCGKPGAADLFLAYVAPILDILGSMMQVEEP